MLCITKAKKVYDYNHYTGLHVYNDILCRSFYNKLKNIYIDIYTHITMYTFKSQKTGYNN